MTEEKIIKDAQYRKGLSIAFFNATNAAISLVGNRLRPDEDPSELLKQVCVVRDFFLKEHDNYYRTIISPIGKMYDSKKTIDALMTATDLISLKTIWRSLSQDERHDGDIRKVAEELKKKFK